MENSFTTADKIEKVDINPVVVNYARSIGRRIAERGEEVNKGSMKRELKILVKTGEIPREYEKELLEGLS